MVSPTAFLRETIDELRLVTWPKRDDVTRLTLVVLIISVVVGVYIGVIDYALTLVTEVIIK